MGGLIKLQWQSRMHVGYAADVEITRRIFDIYRSVESSQIPSLSAALIVCTIFVPNMRKIYVQYVLKTTIFYILSLWIRLLILYLNLALYTLKLKLKCINFIGIL